MNVDQPTSSESSHVDDFAFEYSTVAPSSPCPGSPSESFQYIPSQEDSPAGTPVLTPATSNESSPGSVKSRPSSTLVSPGTVKGHEPADPSSYYSIHSPPGFIPSPPTSPVIPLRKHVARLEPTGPATPTPAPKPKRDYSVSAFHARASSFKEAGVHAPNTTVDASGWYSSAEYRASTQLLEARTADVARLEHELQIQKKHVNELGEKVRSLEELTKDNAALRTTITNLRAERKGVESRVVEASKEAAALRDKLQIEERKVKDIDLRLKVVVEEIVTLEDARELAEVSRTAALQDVQMSEAACQQLRDAILKVTSERDTLSTKLVPLSEALQRSEAALATSTAALGQRTHELSAKTAALAAKDSIEAALRAELGQATSKIQRLSDDLVASTGEKAALEALLAETTAARAKLDQQLADGGNARANDELRERNKVSALEEQVKFEREKAYEDRAALADAVARMADLAAQLELAKAATAQVPGTVETAKAHFETHDQAENLRAEVAQLHHAAEAMATDFANLQSEISQLRATAASDERARHKLLREKAEMGDLIRDLLTALEEQESPAKPAPEPAWTSSRHQPGLREDADESGGDKTPTAQSVGRAFPSPARGATNGRSSVGRPSLLDVAIPSGSMSPEVVRPPPTSPDSPSSPTEAAKPQSIAPSPDSPPRAPSSPKSDGSTSSGGSSYHSDVQDDPLDSGEAGLAIGGGEDASSSSGSNEDGEARATLMSKGSITARLDIAETITNVSKMAHAPASGGDDSNSDEER